MHAIFHGTQGCWWRFNSPASNKEINVSLAFPDDASRASEQWPREFQPVFRRSGVGVSRMMTKTDAFLVLTMPGRLPGCWTESFVASACHFLSPRSHTNERARLLLAWRTKKKKEGGREYRRLIGGRFLRSYNLRRKRCCKNTARKFKREEKARTVVDLEREKDIEFLLNLLNLIFFFPKSKFIDYYSLFNDDFWRKKKISDC